MKCIIVCVSILLLCACAGKGTKKEQKPVSVLIADTDTMGAVIGITRAGVTDTVKKSIKAYAAKKINGAHFTIRYHSPAVRNRVIWGGLVPFDQVWVTGAHMATSIEFDKPVIINKTKIAAGRYALFTIPSKKEWIVILNKNWQQHLADKYELQEDILRMPVQPDSLSYHQERLRYSIDQTGEHRGAIEFYWEKLRFCVPVSLR